MASLQQIFCHEFFSFYEDNINSGINIGKKIAKALKVCMETFSKSIFATRTPLNVLRSAGGNFKYR